MVWASETQVSITDVVTGNLPDGKHDFKVTGIPGVSDITLQGATVTNGTITGLEGFKNFKVAGYELAYNQTGSVQDGGLHISGEFEFPDLKIRSGKMDFIIDEQGLHVISAGLAIGPIEIPGAFGIDGSFDYDPPTIAAEGKVGIPSFDKDSKTLRYFGGGVKFTNAKIGEVWILGHDLNVQLGDSPVYLQDVDIKASGVSSFSTLTLSGDTRFTAGPTVAGRSAYSAKVSGDITPTQGIFNLSGETKVLDFFTVSQGKMSYHAPHYVSASGEGYWNWITKGQLSLKLDNSFSGSINASVKVPGGIPYLGGKTISSMNFDVTDSYIRGTATQSIKWVGEAYATLTVRFTVPPSTDTNYGVRSADLWWEIPVNPIYVMEEQGAGMISLSEWQTLQSQVGAAPRAIVDRPVIVASFNENWQVVDKASTSLGSGAQGVRILADPQTVLQVPEGAPMVIFRVHYERDDVSRVLAQVEGPDGQIHDEVDMHLSSRSAFIVIENPEPGDYLLTVGNPEDLGEFMVEAIVPDLPPLIAMTGLEDLGDGRYEVEWLAFDDVSDAIIEVGLTKHRDTNSYLTIHQYRLSENVTSHIIDANNIDLPSGEYYVTLMIDDDVNAPQNVVSNHRIPVQNPNAPAPVTQVAVAPGDGSFTLRWAKVDDPNVIGYTIWYTEGNNFGASHRRVAIHDPNQTQYTVRDLENGTPLLVTVVAINDGWYNSFPQAKVRVTPHAYDGSTPPKLIGEAPIFAEVGTAYIYSPQYALTGRHHFRGETTPTLTVAQGPVGMEVVTDNRGQAYNNMYILWTPTPDQIGEHEVILQHVTSIPGDEDVVVEEVFTISVVDEGDLIDATSNAILSSPILSAYEGIGYEYLVRTYDVGGSPQFSLAQAPEGMTINQDGVVLWAARGNGRHHFPVRVVVEFSDGETQEQYYVLDLITNENSMAHSSADHILWSNYR